MTRHRLFLALTLLELGVLGALLLHGRAAARAFDARELPALQRLASRLELTDLSLWSEARYTRHPSQADLFTPFQDFPGAPEHFPAGSVVGPEGLRRALAGER
jgi:hypothetical protein